MKKNLIGLSLVLFVAKTVVFIAYADTVTKSRDKGNICLPVTADVNNTKPIYCFSVFLDSGKVISRKSGPNGWSGSQNDGNMKWTTQTNPIHPGGTLGTFCFKITGNGKATWETTDQVGNVIDSGTINLRGK